MPSPNPVIPAPNPSFLRRQEPTPRHSRAGRNPHPTFPLPTRHSCAGRNPHPVIPAPNPSFLRRQEPTPHIPAPNPSFLRRQEPTPHIPAPNPSFLRRQEPTPHIPAPNPSFLRRQESTAHIPFANHHCFQSPSSVRPEQSGTVNTAFKRPSAKVVLTAPRRRRAFPMLRHACEENRVPPAVHTRTHPFPIPCILPVHNRARPPSSQSFPLMTPLGPAPRLTHICNATK